MCALAVGVVLCVPLSRVLWSWSAYDQGALFGFGDPLAVNRPLLNDANVHYSTSSVALLTEPQFGGHIGEITIYPDILAASLVSHLGNANPFGVPERASIATFPVGLSGMALVSRRRRPR
jgi:hypothetical protein